MGLIGLLFVLQATSSLCVCAAKCEVDGGAQSFTSSEAAEMLTQSASGLDYISMLQVDNKRKISTDAARPMHSASNMLASPKAVVTDSGREHDNDEPNAGAVARALSLKPVAWLHIPKTGTSFLNVLYHNPTICPNTPDDVWVPETKNVSPHVVVPFVTRDCPESECCPGGWSTTWLIRVHSCSHSGMGYLYEANAGHWVTMMRNPEQRIISQYNHLLVDPHHMVNVEHPGILKDFAKDMQGCVVKMFARSSMGIFCNMRNLPPPLKEEMDRAIQRLQDGFGFVGITEEFDLTVCLFHAMFGGVCKDEEFDNLRPGPNRTSSHQLYDTSALEGFVDVYDGKLYSEADRIFRSKLLLYGVTASNCPSSCS